MTADQITYALTRNVPDMRERAFTIETTYGALDVPPGHLAKAIANLVEKSLQKALKQIEKQAATQAALLECGRLLSAELEPK